MPPEVGMIVSTTSRPDMCFEVVELSTHFKNATVRDMIAANKAVRKLLSHDYKILYPPLVLDNELRIVLYSDSAYKNLSDWGRYMWRIHSVSC